MNLDELFDKEKLLIYLKKSAGKKVVFFGAGTAGEILLRNLSTEVQIECFVDNDKKKWGQKVGKYEIRNPEVIKNEDVFIFIISRHVIRIRQQLEEYGKIIGKDFENIYSLFERYFRMEKALDSQKKYLSFLKRIPRDVVEGKMCISPLRIGIIVLSNVSVLNMWYDITLAIVLKANGYHTSLIFDFQKGFPEIMQYEGVTEDIKKIVYPIIDYLRENFKGIPIHIVEENEIFEIDAEDIEEIEKVTYMTCRGQLGHLGYKLFDKTEKEIEELERELGEKNKELLISHLGRIRSFFESEKFDVMNVMGGITERKSLYAYEAHKRKIRVSCYDTGFWTTDSGRSAADIERVIKEKLLNADEREKIIAWAKSDFLSRKAGGDDYNNWLFKQKVYDTDAYKKVEVLIPLNIMFDSAALGLDYLFQSQEQWLIETVKFLLDNTDCNILVQEHPAQAYDLDYYYKGFDGLLHQYFGDEERIIYRKADETINTYDVISSCKVVLPFSSTVGLESVLLKTPIVVATKCYYCNLSFANSPDSKESYFGEIKKIIDKPFKFENMPEEALLAYGLIRNYTMNTDFTEQSDKWLELDINELKGMIDIRAIQDCIVNNVPAIIERWKV